MSIRRERRTMTRAKRERAHKTLTAIEKVHNALCGQPIKVRFLFAQRLIRGKEF